MALTKTGKLGSRRGLGEAFEAVANAGDVERGIVRIVSAQASGLIACRSARWIVGARVTGTELRGQEALERLQTVSRGIWIYTACSNDQEFARVDDFLLIDLEKFLYPVSRSVGETAVAAAEPPSAPQQPPVPSEANGASLADKIFGNTKRTLLQLQSLDRLIMRPQQPVQFDSIPENEPIVPLPVVPGNAAPQPKAGFALISDTIRKTAWRLMARALDAQNRIDAAQQREQDVRRVRSAEIIAEETGDNEKPASVRRRVDLASIAGLILASLAVAVTACIWYYCQHSSPYAQYMDNARDLIKRSQWSAAIEQLTLALESSPRSEDALKMRAEALEKTGDFIDAGADYEALVERRPQNITFLLPEAIAYYRAGKWEKVVAAGERARDAGTAYGAALLCMAAENSDERAKTPPADWPAADRVPGDLKPDFFAAHANAYNREGNRKAAIEEYSKALNLEPDETRFLIARGQCYLASGEYKNAVHDLEQATTQRATDPQLLTSLGRAYAGAGAFEKAIETYRYAYAFGRARPDLLVNIAECEMRLHRYGDTVATCDQALALAPGSQQVEHLREQAMVLAHSGKAIVTVHNLDDRPTGPDKRTPAQKARDQLQAATEYLVEVTRAHPGDSVSRTRLAHAYLMQGDSKAAFQEFLCLEEQGALEPASMLPYAQAAIASGDTQKAVELLRNCLSRNPRWQEARVTFIRLCKSLGYMAKAQQLADEGAALAASVEERAAYTDALK